MKKLFLFFLVTLSVVEGSFSQPTFIKDSLDKYAEREMKRWNVPGMAVAVVKDGNVVVAKGYGIKDASAPLSATNKVDENTLFQIASNTKAFTATSLALLDEQKRISLDDKVTKWIPDFKLHDELATREVTVRDLLCHRIGFQTFQSDLLNWNCNLSRKELIHNMRNVKPVFSFRSHYGYCNAAFLTAGEIIPAATDTSWDDFLRFHFFLPLKMNRTSTTYKTITADNNACKPYTLVDDKLVLLPYANVDNLGPAASINSCVKDLANWLLMQLDSGKFEGKRIFPYEVLQTTQTSNMIVRDMPASSGANFQNYGLGWFLLDYNGKKMIRHDGGADGFVTTTCFIPSLNLGIVVLTNTDANSFYAALRSQIIDAYMNLPYQNMSEKFYRNFSANTKMENAEINKLREAASKKPIPSMKMEEYAGSYTNEVYGKIAIIGPLPPISFGKPAPKPQEHSLTILFTHHPFLKGNLLPLGDNDFLCTYSLATYGIKKIHFNVVNGKVKSVIIRVNDFVDMMEYEFVKE
ncbi:MAG: serine hydrolase [Bacteroidetes bacterium]|nr:serine hydrolase [Bacteroidota bacterium]